ncbi:hypothetical protein EC988_005576 [Linderina pennispora]|nr:hypothetical protein EC988_005576 [Linderina pennispora]
MLLYSYTSQPHFRSIKLRPRKPSCAVCGDAPSITELVDYVAFCGSGPNDAAADLHILQDPSQRISCRQYSGVVHSGQPHVLLDVREKVQFDICQLPNSLNIPLADFDKRRQELTDIVAQANGKPIYALCRRGNDSQYAVQYIRNKLDYKECYDIVRGLLGWQADVDSEFPAY